MLKMAGMIEGVEKVKRKITVEGILRLLNDAGELFLPTRLQAWKNIHETKILGLEDYFPSEVKRSLISLRKKGKVDVEETKEGWKIKMTAEGKHELLKYDVQKFVPNKGEWDGKWRIVFFDVEESDRKARDRFRYYLNRLGLKQLQRSVWVTPYEVMGEIKHIREMLNITYDVRLGILEEIENADSLRRWFGVGKQL